MGRSRSAPRPAARPAARPASQSSGRPSYPPPPAHTSAPPPPAMPQQGGGGGFLSGMVGAVAQGAALGTGSAIAHRAVDAVMGPRTVVHEHAPAAGAAAPAAAAPMAGAPAGADGPCGPHARAFAECIASSGGDMGACSAYFQAMEQCKLANPPRSFA